MIIETPRLVIAAPSSGCGKSTVATGLMAALAATRRVQGFKVGPDYIDPGYHTAASGRVSRNLDTWLMAPAGVQAVFARAVAGADIAIIEGVMGLFDGYSAHAESGSTAEVAKLLGAPVILVLDVSSMARSAAALACGYRDYDPMLSVAGVICNHVASEQHARWVREAIEDVGLPVLGCLPRLEALRIPERHLGLEMAVERRATLPAFLQHLAGAVSQYVDLQRVQRIAETAQPLDLALPEMAAPSGCGAPQKASKLSGALGAPAVRIAVARDEAFCFYYEDNLDLLRAAGAEVVPFSPLADPELPADCAGLYLGGGYPELYGPQLAANRSLRLAIRSAHEAGMPIYAECGGLMVLTESIRDLAGETWPMVGILPGQARLRAKLVMGYRLVTAQRDSLLLRQGEQVRGHEFHYSDWVGYPADLPYAYEIRPNEEGPASYAGVAHNGLLASYVHLHFGAWPELALRLVDACRRWQEQRRTSSAGQS